VLALTPRLIRESRDAVTDRALDVPGAVTITAGIALLVFGVTRGQEDGFGAAGTVLLLAAAAALIAAFVLIERGVRRPLVPFRFFGHRAVTAANVVALCGAAVIAGQGFFSTLYLQQVLGFSPIETGLSFLPVSLAAFAVGIAVLVSIAVSATEGSGAAGQAARLVDGYSAGYPASGIIALAGAIAALLLVPRVRPDAPLAAPAPA